MKQQVDLKDNVFAKLFRKYFIRLLILGVCIGGISAAGYFYLKSSTYTATGQLVQNDNNYSIVTSYQQFITTKRFKKAVSTKIDESEWNKYSGKKDYTIQLAIGSSSPFFAVNATSKNAKYSVFLTNAAMQVLMGNIGKYLSGSNISLVNEAKSATKVSYKSKVAIIGLAGFAGSIIVFFGCALVTEIYVGKIRDEEYLQNIAGLKNLGTISIGKD